MIGSLQLAIEGDEPARRIWTLRNLEREAFSNPHDAAGTFRSPAGPLAVAYALGQHFEIPYGYLRKTVVDYVERWITDLEAR